MTPLAIGTYVVASPSPTNSPEPPVVLGKRASWLMTCNASSELTTPSPETSGNGGRLAGSGEHIEEDVVAFVAANGIDDLQCVERRDRAAIVDVMPEDRILERIVAHEQADVLHLAAGSVTVRSKIGVFAQSDSGVGFPNRGTGRDGERDTLVPTLSSERPVPAEPKRRALR